MPLKFKETNHDTFYKSLANALKLEFIFTRQVAAGQAQARPDIVEKFVQTLLTNINFLAENIPIANIGVNIVNGIANLIVSRREAIKEKRKQSFIESLTQEDFDVHYEYYINNIAREATYRYGISLNYLLKQLEGQENSRSIIESLTNFAALRIMFYALKYSISLENCETLVNSLIEGYEGFEGIELVKILNEVPLFDRISNFGSRTFTADGFFANCGYITPEDMNYSFYIDQKLESNNVVTYNNNDKRNRKLRNELVPKYGYAFTPKLPTSNTLLGCHYPDKSNPFLKLLRTNSFQFVSQQQLEGYLASAEGKTLTIDFATWLKKTNPRTYQSNDLYPIFRGTITEGELKRKGLSFSLGQFIYCDFSFCTFENVSFTKLYHCILHCSELNNCSATNNSLIGSDFSLSRFTSCNFQGLKGIIYFNYAKFSSTCLNDSDISGSILGASCDAETIESSAKSTTEVNGSKESLSLVLKEQMLVYEKKIQERLENKSRIQDQREENQRLLNERFQEQINEIHRNLKKEKEITSSPATTYELNEVERKRLYAFNKSMLENSIEEFRIGGIKDQLLSQLFEGLFFARPAMLLREFAQAEDNIIWTNIERNLDYSVSGIQGSNGTPGSDGETGSYGGGSGTDAHNGLDGQAGSNSGSIVMSIVSVANQNIFLVTPQNSNSVMLPLFDSNTTIHLSARGGDGGNGGKGGKGGKGASGIDGIDATSESVGTNGTNGGNGGKGGNGGHGGNAGNSGNIEIFVKEADIDLLSCIESCDVSQALGGKGGEFGVGGIGGSGGRGGRSATKEISTRNSDGTYSKTYITLPGGAAGVNGRPGIDGRSGTNGLNGSAGKVSYKIIPEIGGNIEEVTKIFDLQLVSFDEFVTDTGIIEPNQNLFVSNIQLTNIGEVKAPKNRIEVSLIPSKMIEIDNKIMYLIPDTILPKKSLTLNSLKFNFKVSKTNEPQIGVVFQSETFIRLTATIVRLKRILKSFNIVPRAIQIRYPVELSVPRGALVLAVGKLIPFAIKVRNVSLVSLGSCSENPRALRVKVAIFSGNYTDLELTYHVDHDDNCSDSFSLDNPFICDIHYLKAGEEYTIYGSLSIQQLPSDRVYEILPIEVTLYIGNLDNPMALSTLITVQREVFSMQLAEEVRLPILSNDLLIIANHTTTKQEISHWKLIANQLNMQINVWNLSLYSGFSFFYQEYQIIENLKHGIVIIFNKPCHQDNHDAKYLDTKRYPLDCIEKHEIFEAARRYGIRTLIINKPDKNNAFPVLFPVLSTPLAALQRKQGNIQRVIDNPLIQIPLNKKKEQQPFLKNSSSGNKSKHSSITEQKLNSKSKKESNQELSIKEGLQDIEEEKEKEEDDADIDNYEAEEEEEEQEEQEEISYNKNTSNTIYIKKKKIDITTLNELEFASRSTFYRYLSWFTKDGRNELLSPYYQYIELHQTRLFTVPDTISFDKRFNIFMKQVQLLCPTKQYFFYPTFKPLHMKSSKVIFKKYIIGEIELRRGLDKTTAMIAYQNQYNKHSLNIEIDETIIIKLLPFETKLTMFIDSIVKSKNASLHQIIGNMIVSDIIDEQHLLYSFSLTNSKVTKKQIQHFSTFLNTFHTFDFHSLQTNTKVLQLILYNLYLYCEKSPKQLFQHSKVHLNLLKIIKSMLRTYFTEITMKTFHKSASDWSINMQMNDISFEKLFQKLIDPYTMENKNISFNHWSTSLPSNYRLTEENANYNYQPKVKDIQPDRFCRKSTKIEHNFFSNSCDYRTRLPKHTACSEDTTKKSDKINRVWYHGMHRSFYSKDDLTDN